jgi:predicted transcriptional regulator
MCLDFLWWFFLVKYRNRLNIIADILGVAGSGAKKTRIMYVANLSYGLLEKYLGVTVGLGFLRSDGNRYAVTEKGESFLEKYSVFSRKSSEAEKKFRSISFEREALKRMCERPRAIKARAGNGRKR